jgi:hypothetical protein
MILMISHSELYKILIKIKALPIVILLCLLLQQYIWVNERGSPQNYWNINSYSVSQLHLNTFI